MSTENMQWFPIESAPKETTVLLYGAKKLPYAVGMHREGDGWLLDSPHVWQPMYPPTHWMPLPEPPQ